ncbi:MAG: hypothetical protein DWI01_01540 [Planctomycetota bacterium]|jgi:hypothetical protein|nr:MAG: hypothetical protein DWI01_01540 [Planctomycetota bacterium]
MPETCLPVDAHRDGTVRPTPHAPRGLLSRLRPTAHAAGIAAFLLLVLVAGQAWGCPTCKDGVAESDPEGMNIARGYFYSILIMLAMPFTLAGSFGAYVWREMRRQERARLEGRDPFSEDDVTA